MVVTKYELIPAFYNSYDSLKKELWRYKDKPYGIKRAQFGGNGRKLFVKFDSLPRHIQDAIGDPRKLNHPLEPYYATDPAAVKYYVDFTYPDGSYILPDTQEKYIINASVCQALLKLKQARTMDRLAKGGSVAGIMNTLCFDAQSFLPTLKAKHQVSHNLPSHPRKFKEKLAEFEKVGYIALVKDAQQKAKRNALKVTPETVKILNNLFASQSHKPTPTEIHRQYNAFLSGYIDVIDNETGEVISPKGFKSLSERSIQHYLTAWENKIGTYALRSGNRQELMRQFKPYHSLLQPTMAGSLISIDDRQPPFWYEQGKRVWFYAGVDLASEAMICWVHGKTKDGIILDFYRQLVRNYAEWGIPLPAGLECESSLNSSFTNSFLQEGAMFDYVRIEPNNARGKRVEAYWKPLRYGSEKKREGWIARPFAKSEANQPATEKPNTIIAYDKIIKGCLQDIVNWNNTEHSQHDGISRWDYFLQNQNPALKPTNYKAILPHLGYKTETSCNVGIIKLQYGEYLLGDNGQVCLGEELIRLMRQVEGQDIDIYWIDDNDGQVIKALIYNKSGRYICEAVAKPKYNRATIEQTDADHEAREIMSAYVATIEAYQRQQMRAIDPITVIDNRPTTIGNSFSIPGITQFSASDPDDVEVIGEVDDDNEYAYEAEMADGNEEVFTWKKQFQI